MKTMLEHAGEYATNGWWVLPLRGKIPYTRHGAHDATTDPGTIISWWYRWPDANIGAVVDPHLLVLDVDPRNGGDPNKLNLTKNPDEYTSACFSGRGDGGRHLYFQRPAFPLSSRKLPPGIDLKLNGYCVVPPSIHPDSGEPYLWYNEQPIRPLPTHLAELLRADPPPPRTASTSDGKGLVAFVANQSEGNRNNALYWAACRAREDNTLDGLATELIAAAVSTGLDAMPGS